MRRADDHLAARFVVAAVEPPERRGRVHAPADDALDLLPRGRVVHAADNYRLRPAIDLHVRAPETLRDGDDLHAPGGRVPRRERDGLVAPELGVAEMLPGDVLRLDGVGVAEEDIDLSALVALQSGDPRDRRREPAPGPAAADEDQPQAFRNGQHQRRRPGVGKVDGLDFLPHIIPRFCHLESSYKPASGLYDGIWLARRQ